MNDNWPDGPPHPTTAEYMLLRMVGDEIYPLVDNKAVSKQDVDAYYIQRYGRLPKWKIAWQQHLWVGPVPPRENHERE